MTKFSEFANLLSENDADRAISFFRKNEGDILRGYRRLLEEDNYNEYWEQDHTVFDELINSRLSKGDETAEDIIRRLLSERIFLNEPTPDGFTPVSLLAYAGRFDLVRHAVECGADLNKGSHPALTGAVYSRELPQQWEQVVTFLLDHGADPNGSTGSKPPLFPAIAANHGEAIRLLSSRGADVNRIHDIPSWGDFSGTALHWAVRSAYTDHTNLETTKLLLELGADPTIKNKSGYGPVDFAFDKDYEENQNVRPLIELLSSRDEWRRSSWRLNQAPPFRDNPIRRKPNPRSDYRDLKWDGVEYRIGDRVEVIRRGGWMEPSLPDDPDAQVHSRPVIALPGLSGTVVTFSPGGGGDCKYFRAVVDWDPGTWEEADNYGKTVRLPQCRASIFPEVLKIIEVEENFPGSQRRSNLASGAASDGGDAAASVLNWKLVAVVAVALIILFLVIR
jgi:ankyrin repeat protein